MEQKGKQNGEKESITHQLRQEFLKSITHLPLKYAESKLNNAESGKNISIIIKRYEIITKENKKVFKSKKYFNNSNKVVELNDFLDNPKNKLITQFDNFPVFKESYEWHQTYSSFREFLLNEYQKNKSKMAKERVKKERGTTKLSCFSFFCWKNSNSADISKVREKSKKEGENKFRLLNTSLVEISKSRSKEIAGVMKAPMHSFRKSNSIVKSEIVNVQNKGSKIEISENNEGNINNFVSNKNKEEEKLVIRHIKNLSASINLNVKKFASNVEVNEDYKRQEKSPTSDNNMLLISSKNTPRRPNIFPYKKEFNSMKNMNDIEFPIKLLNKQIDFFLTGDILKCLQWFQKENNNEFILHTHTFNNSRTAFKQDTYILDIYLRTNITALLENKSIKLPLLCHGNVYFPHLTFIRGNYQKGFTYLNHPFVCPLLLSQLANSDFAYNQEDMNKINFQIIKETIVVSEALNYSTLVVNLNNLNFDEEISHLVKLYCESFLNEPLIQVKNIVFVLAYPNEGFYHFMTRNEFLNTLLIKNNISCRIFQE